MSMQASNMAYGGDFYVPYYSNANTFAAKSQAPLRKSEEILQQLKSFQDRKQHGNYATYGVFQSLLPVGHPRYEAPQQYIAPPPTAVDLTSEEKFDARLKAGTSRVNMSPFNSLPTPSYQEPPKPTFQSPIVNTSQEFASGYNAPYSPPAQQYEPPHQEFSYQPPVFDSPPQNQTPVGGSIKQAFAAFLREINVPSGFSDVFAKHGITDLDDQDVDLLDNLQQSILTNRVYVNNQTDRLKIMLLSIGMSVDSSTHAPQVLYISSSEESLRCMQNILQDEYSHLNISSTISGPSAPISTSQVLFSTMKTFDLFCVEFIDDVRLIILDDADRFLESNPQGTDDYDAFVVLRTDILDSALCMVVRLCSLFFLSGACCTLLFS
eukprot:TRINITY_DN1922_c0_g1_i2.p1 TRINITY_DN1922_c0_g1~~TRINITY_DN1922_c0_g1_i2.p1  ORF type:complete len:379 (+),score=73.65 TRINITY_DN1922_c0_g1_i2:78-1214(+)